ncbi:Ribosome biogenesis regulatory protein (RRS1) family protein [Cryptosporidium meleagridis]|uniref:Ribosome biogenesis regulatory protein n=1 Tax=Cryptosporidium meleagridis TaxID=93969 RepID=A0A2P4YZM2_9CRYT|nr:Ribosome biogenesis regulatory protein (RRS1) family protein [Cryptosporidium meleagridis]
MEGAQLETSPLEVCLSNLIGIDISSINETEISKSGANNLQLMLNSIWSDLSKENTKDGIVVSLPSKQEILLPRAYPLPTKKEKTRWEKFAELKGIKKRKRSRMVYDPITDDFVPRWGRNSIKKIQKKHNEAIIEIKGNMDENKDPREAINLKRDMMINKQRLRELKNKMNSSKNKNNPKSDEFALGIGNLKDTNIKRSKTQVKELFDRVSLSTASYGRRDKALPDEDRTTNKVKKAKKILDIKSENEKYKSIYSKILKQNFNL